MSDRETTADLMARLHRHYIKPGQALKGGVFIPECGLNGTTGRRCDALYVGFTSTSGRLLVGHEVKASRADWLHELDQIHKATTWADQCHEWWLVTAPGIVRDGELPAGWGHLEPGTSRTRMTVKVKAHRHLDRQPSWDVVRSVIARLDTLQVQDRQAFEQAVRTRLHDEFEERLATHRERLTVDPEMQRKARALDTIEAELGVSLSDWQHQHHLSPREFIEAARVAEVRRDLSGRWDALRGSAEDLRRQAKRLDEMAAAVADLTAAAEPTEVAR